MNPLRIFLLAALVLVVFGTSPGSANSTEFDFNFDDPETGEGNVDIGNNIELSIEIENLISNSKEFRLEITNSVEYEEKGLRAWWSHDGQAALASESRILDGVDVSGESTRNGITVTVEAEDNAQYGTWDIDLKCKDNGDSNQDHIEYLTLKISVDEYSAVSLEIGGGGSTEGSVDVDGETTYEIKVNNEGNRENTFSLSLSTNDWESDLSDNSVTIDAFSSKTVTLTIEADNGVDYGDSDEVTIAATSTDDSNVQDDLQITTYVREEYGLRLLSNSGEMVSGEPGDTITFNFKLLNKWSDSVNYEITKKDWYKGQIGNRPEGWTFVEGTGTLDAFEEQTAANVKIAISSDADAGEVVTIIVQAIASDDAGEGNPVELEIQISVEGEYNVVIVLPQSDTISLDANQTTSISQYVLVQNLASVSDVVTVSASWQLGGNDWNLSLPDPLILSESEQKPLFITVRAPQSASGDQASLSIRVVSGGDSSKYDEVTLSFSVSEPYTSGCTDPEAKNYDEAAQRDDGSCDYPIKGCMNSTAMNYLPEAEAEDNSCKFAPTALVEKETRSQYHNISVDKGQTVQFSGTGTDVDGVIVKYEWDFYTDGVYDWSSEENGLTTFIYNEPGRFTATFRVTDNDGNTATDTFVVNVKPGIEDMNDSGWIPSISLITSLISIGLIAIYRRK